jgi:hypothetical protein
LEDVNQGDFRLTIISENPLIVFAKVRRKFITFAAGEEGHHLP